ncbi:MAG: hypothetical protein B6D41_01995 [Chloroflexi bacterium UTCFX4]|jgi:uncharacterized protein (DUF433 family)|nr:MAG: hypothetical protein B6D41_01995 [Chloroflexi bacterium UTCFX4]
MDLLQQVEQLLAELSRSEKAQVLQWVVQDLGEAFPGIQSDPDVSGGEPCIVRTRIPVWLLVQARRLGSSEADLLRSYPSLRAEDLTNAWAYARAHRNEIEQQIIESENA